MALDKFTLRIDGEQLGGDPETTATLILKVQGRDAIIDEEANKLLFPIAGSRTGISIGLPYNVELPTDVASGSAELSEQLGYYVLVRTDDGGRVESYFAARAADSVAELTDLAETVIVPISDTIAARDAARLYRDQAETAAGRAEGFANDAEDAAASVGAGVGATTAQNVLTLGVKADVVTVTDAAITAGQAALSSVAVDFVTADVGKIVHVVGAGAPSVNKGAWAADTAYNHGDRVTFAGQTYYAFGSFTSGASFTINSWVKHPATSATLVATILSVAGGVATLDTPAGTTVAGATAHYGTDDSDAVAALGPGDWYFPAGRTVFLADWFIPSHTVVTFGPGTTFRLPAYPSTDVAPFRLLTEDRTSTQRLQDIHLHGVPTIDLSDLTPPVGTTPRGVHVLNVEDFSIEGVVGVGFPGQTGNVVQVGANQGLAEPRNGRIGAVRAKGVRGLGSSAVQHTGGVDIDYGVIRSDGGVAFRCELDGNALATDNVTVELAHATNESGFGNAAVYLTAHDHTIRNVHIAQLLAEGGCDGVTLSKQTGGALEDCTIGSGRVTGGGRGTNTTSNGVEFPGVKINGLHVDAAKVVPALRSTAGTLGGAGFAVAPGMTFRSCRATSCEEYGFRDVSPGTAPGPGSRATLIDCDAISNTGPGYSFRGIEHVLLVGGQATDDIARDAPITTQLLDTTHTTGTLTGWSAGAGASAAAGAGGVLTVTADGTSTGAVAKTATGISQLVVTPNHFYRFSADAVADTCPADAKAVASLWFYKADGTVSQVFSGSTPQAMPSSLVFYAQAPADAAFAAVVVKFFSNTTGETLTAGWRAKFSGFALGEVTGIATQTYGIEAAAGVTVDHIGTDLTFNGTAETAGAGTVTNLAGGGSGTPVTDASVAAVLDDALSKAVLDAAYSPKEHLNTVAAAGTTEALPAPSVASFHDVTLSAASCALTLPSGFTGPASVTVLLRQDGTGGRAVTFTNGTLQWLGDGTQPALKTTPGGVTALVFFTPDGGASWYGSGTVETVFVPAGLDALPDVTAPSPTTGDGLSWNGTAWVNEPKPTALTVNDQTGNYTLVLADAGKAVDVTAGSAAAVTVPLHSSVAFPIGTVIEVSQLGAGQVTLTPASAGVTIRTASSLTTRAQYSVVSLRKLGTNTWLAGGDLT